MSNQKHTSGPLTVQRATRPDNVGGYDCAILNEAGHIIGEAFEIPDHGVRLPAHANATLFAAAPGLLEELQALERLGSRAPGMNLMEFWPEFYSRIRTARAAIAKAKGAE